MARRHWCKSPVHLAHQEGARDSRHSADLGGTARYFPFPAHLLPADQGGICTVETERGRGLELRVVFLPASAQGVPRVPFKLVRLAPVLLVLLLPLLIAARQPGHKKKAHRRTGKTAAAAKAH